MAVVISLGIAVLVVAFVVAPFFLLDRRSPVRSGGNSDESDTLQELLAERETIYAAIQELDFDFKSGKLSAEDHQTLRRRHEAQAAAVLKRIDEAQAKPPEPEKPRSARRNRQKT
jgi:uncharacterized protein involved in type VI secretion and phage assembly